jgi:hypothetical protein
MSELNCQLLALIRIGCSVQALVVVTDQPDTVTLPTVTVWGKM